MEEQNHTYNLDNETYRTNIFQETHSDMVINIGFVHIDDEKTGNMFLLISDEAGNVIQVFKAPQIIFERLISMITMTLDEPPHS